jgi:hypothetical protein
MRLSSALPVAMMFFKHWHIDDTEAGIVIVKAAFRRHVDGTFRALPAPDWMLEDRFAGDPAWTPLVQEQDIAPGKEACDLTVAAVARAPGGQARRDWPVGVAIAGRLTYGFHVRGPAHWHRQGGRWHLAAPEPVSEVPLTYALAWGGAAPGADGGPPEVAEGNPAGRGFSNARRLNGDDPFAAPQIGDLAEFMAADPAQPMMIHGVGPVAKSWLPRRAHAGTFDQAWRDLRHPRMPYDHALRFWNAAPRPLQIDGGLQGNETVRLTGISAGWPELPCPLPAVRLWLVPDAGTALPLTLDTVQIDVTDPDPLAHGMTLLWRARLPDPGAVTFAEVHSEDLEPLP